MRARVGHAFPLDSQSITSSSEVFQFVHSCDRMSQSQQWQPDPTRLETNATHPIRRGWWFVCRPTKKDVSVPRVVRTVKQIKSGHQPSQCMCRVILARSLSVAPPIICSSLLVLTLLPLSLSLFLALSSCLFTFLALCPPSSLPILYSPHSLPSCPVDPCEKRRAASSRHKMKKIQPTPLSLGCCVLCHRTGDYGAFPRKW